MFSQLLNAAQSDACDTEQTVDAPTAQRNVSADSATLEAACFLKSAIAGVGSSAPNRENPHKHLLEQNTSCVLLATTKPPNGAVLEPFPLSLWCDLSVVSQGTFVTVLGLMFLFSVYSIL